jgi:Lrp/AsnC family transcriptional regulator for asnA, asnC and gidA
MNLALSRIGSKEGRLSCTLDSVDRQIIRVLQQDGRTSNVEIARQVGVSEATVRKRLDRLVSEGTIRITAIPHATKLGFSTITFMTISVDLAQVGQITEQIAQVPEVRAIYLTAGETDVIVEAWFTCSDDLLRFMTQHIGPIPGIRRTTTTHVLRTIKDGSGWILPAALPVLDPDGAA